MNIGMDVKPDGAVILKRVIIVVLMLYDLVSMMWIKQQILCSCKLVYSQHLWVSFAQNQKF